MTRPDKKRPKFGELAPKTSKQKRAKKDGEGQSTPEHTPSSETKIVSASDRAQAALVQITIGLYRALAGEIARTFTIHARQDFRHQPHGDQLELAGQLTIELDKAPDAALRARSGAISVALSRECFGHVGLGPRWWTRGCAKSWRSQTGGPGLSGLLGCGVL